MGKLREDVMKLLLSDFVSLYDTYGDKANYKDLIAQARDLIRADDESPPGEISDELLQRFNAVVKGHRNKKNP